MTTLPTAADVLAGLDLTGRTAVVTGGYSGLGLATTRALTGAGARVVVPARRPDVARRALAGLPGADVDELDLADPGSVRRFAERYRAGHRALHILIANAGIMACPPALVGPGWEAHFGTNHLGHYALTCLLWPALAAAGSARVVAVTSGRNPDWRIRWDDVHFTRGYDRWAAYAQSKFANLLFARHLDRLGSAYGIHGFSANPGWILTPLQRHLTTAEMVALGWIDDTGRPALEVFRSAEQGAATQVWAATSPELGAAGGAYCTDCRAVPGSPGDDEDAARLWELSAELTGIDQSSV